MVKPGKFGHLHLVYHFTIPLKRQRIVKHPKSFRLVPLLTLILWLIKFSWPYFILTVWVGCHGFIILDNLSVSSSSAEATNFIQHTQKFFFAQCYMNVCVFILFIQLDRMDARYSHQAFQWIFCMWAINCPCKEVFSQIVRAIALGFLGGL